MNPCAKVGKVYEILEDALSTAYVTCRQLALLFECMPQGELWRYPHSRDTFYKYGSYRVELLITLMCRIVDLYNFEVVLNVLSPQEVGCIYARVGYFNGVCNPMKPEGYYMFNISRHVEDRQVRATSSTLCIALCKDPLAYLLLSPPGGFVFVCL